jgi:DNA-binding protein YbaB
MPRTTSNSSARRDVDAGSGSMGSIDTSFDPDEWRKELEAELDHLESAHEEIMRTQGTGEVENGLITVVVDGPGRIQELVIHPDAFRETDPQQFAELLLEAISKACADLDAKVAEKSQLLDSTLET